MLDRLAEPLCGGFGSTDDLPPGWREALEGLRDAHTRAEADRERLAAGLERTTQELQELLVEVDALRRARASAESTNLVRGEILTTVSRAMRSPTDAILGLSGLLRAGALLPTQRSYVDAVHGAADVLLTILNDVSDFSRLEAGTLPLEPIPFDLRVMLEDAATVLTAPVQAKGLTLRFSWRPDALRRVTGDPGRIRQIVSTLVLDALVRTEEGEIVIEAGRIAGGDGPGAVVLVVEDTGMEIPADLIHSLFEPFNRGDTYPVRNSGLPLAIARQLARLMGGDLAAEALPNGGMRFVAVLPLPAADPEQAPAPTLESRPAHGASAGQVLIVESDPDARATWGAIAEAAGYDAAGVPDRHAVLERLRRELDAGRHVEVVVFSDHDAEGYEELGRTILADLAGDRPSLVMLPAVGHPGDVRALRQAGFMAYLVKPVSPADLREVLETIRRVPPPDRHTIFLTRHSLAESRVVALSAELEATLQPLQPAEEPSAEPPSHRRPGRQGGSSPRARATSD